MDAIRVGALLDDKKFDLRLTLLAGEQGLSRRISASRIQKPGLVLAGFTEHLHRERVQVFGNTEMSYLATLPRERAVDVLRRFFAQDVACLVVTKGLEVPPEMSAAAEEAGVPLLRTTHLSSTFIESVQTCLVDVLTAQTSMHGVLLDVFGVGILLLGKSGIGKS
jgi:HPr kinase/phosphorylase